MKIAFEKWIEENHMPDCAIELFKESIICYKVSAYKSAFVMAYSGLQIIIKERLLSADCIPTNMEESQWNAIRRKLGNEDKWDAEVYDCVNRSDDKRVFLINDAIVTQYKALKTYRNICAHGKRGEISYYHIDLLWSFIQENFYKFVINGGKSGIIQMITDHYDVTITEPGKNSDYLLNNIACGIRDDELNDFFDELYKLTSDDSDSYFYTFMSDSKPVEIWSKIVASSDTRIRTAALTYIQSQPVTVILDFVEKYPHLAKEIISNPALARMLWTGKVFDKTGSTDGAWCLICALINEGLVPSDERIEFDKKLYKFIGTSFLHKVDILKKTTYFELLRKDLFNTSKYSTANSGILYANKNATAFKNYINQFGLDIEAVKCINVIFSFAHFGPFYKMVRNIMKDFDTFLKYKSIVKSNNLHDYSDEFEDEEEEGEE